jgi:uncharacterized membrane protein
VLAIAVDNRLLARELLLAGTRLSQRGSFKLTDAALVMLNRRGKPRIVQTREMNPSQGAAAGVWWGGVLGLLLFGLAGWVAGGVLGAGLGWWRAKSRDTGVPDDWMRHLADRLSPDETAVVFEMKDVYSTHLLRELRRFSGRLLAATISDVEEIDIEDALSYIV